MRYLANDPYVSKIFLCDKATTAISVEYNIWNQWFSSGGSCAQYVQVLNNTKNTQVRNDYYDAGNIKQTIHHRQQFNITCDAGDELEVRFISPDPGNGNQMPRVRNVVVTSDALGDAELPD